MLELRHQARLEGEGRVLQPQASTTLPVPESPTEMAKELHRLTHTPTAAWCEHCMQGKAKAGPHGQMHPTVESERRAPTVQLDYMFMSGIDEEDEKLMPCLTGLDEQTSHPLCVFLPSKTITFYVVEVVIDFLERLGHQRVMLFSDGEPAMLSLMRNVQEKRGAQKTLIKHTPRYSGQSIGRFAIAQQHLQGL
eukprot:5880315-Amphidinium_carterae.1